MLTVAFLLLATSAGVEPPASSGKPAAPTVATAVADEVQPAPIDPATVKCRSIREVNSRIPTRICRTIAEWDRIDADNQKSMTAQKRGGGQKPASGTIFG